MRIVAAEAAVSFAVETLGKLLIEKAEFLVGVEEDVEWLKKELRSMQCFLKDAAKKQSDSESIRNLLSDIREVAHDAEDAIEIFVLKVQSKSVKRRYGCFPNHLYHLNKIGEQILSIRQTLKDIQDRRVRYDIQKDVDDGRAEPSTRARSQEFIQTRRRLAYWKPDQHVVGLDEDVRQLLGKAVFEKNEGLSVSAVLGMGGMGKSTLAGKIYNHPEVVGRFDCRSWVVVSSEFNPEDVMKQILLQLGISVDELKRLGSIDDKVGRQEEFKKELHQRLAGKRYFIVLDDVWEAEHWESLSTAFPADGDKGSSLLLTSRNQVITTDDGYMHKIKALNENESWELFMRKAFGGNYSSIGGCPEELKKVGKEILKKCGGLPLAISVVGGLLAKKTRSKSEWEKVHTEMKSHLDTCNGDLNTITTILELSYQNLTLELKACFLCLGFFKEDAVIKAKELVHIWVAQGLVPKEVEGEGVRMEDIARDYLNELISRNMVQVKEMEYDIVKYCQMHDLLRDLSIRKAKEEIDFEVLREEQNSHQFLHRPRHRAIYCSEARFVYSTDQNQHLRSLFVHFEDRCRLHVSSGQSSYWKSFELLRVLDLGNTIFKVLPKGIGVLNGLKYLRMSYSGKASRLPRSWAKLKNLEVLHLRGYGEGEGIKIDKVVLKMKSLRHLYLYVEFCEVGLETMWNLQTLHLFRVKNSSDPWKIEGMSGVPILKTNWLWSLPSLQSHTSMPPLTRLKLRGILPLHFPPNLSHLNLTQMRLDKDRMHILEKLPKLIHLKLQYMDIYVGTVMIKSGGFPSLKVLHIKNIDYVWKMEIEEGAMPELDQFIIRQCPNFDVENLPAHIKSAIIVQAH